MEDGEISRFHRESPEIVEKLSRMTPRQRESRNREMISLRNRGLGMEKRRRIHVDKSNAATGRH